MESEKGKLLKSGDVLIMVSKQGGYQYISIVKVTQNFPCARQPHCSVEILEVLKVEAPLVVLEGTSLYTFYEDLLFPKECSQEIKQLLVALEKTCYCGAHRMPTPYDKVFQGNVA